MEQVTEPVEVKQPVVDRFIDNEDFEFLKQADEKVVACHKQLGVIEEEKLKVLELVRALRQNRQEKVKEMEIKYRIPKGSRWNIDADHKKIIFFDKDGNVVDVPVVIED